MGTFDAFSRFGVLLYIACLSTLQPHLSTMLLCVINGVIPVGPVVQGSVRPVPVATTVVVSEAQPSVMQFVAEDS